MSANLSAVDLEMLQNARIQLTLHQSALEVATAGVTKYRTIIATLTGEPPPAGRVRATGEAPVLPGKATGGPTVLEMVKACANHFVKQHADPGKPAIEVVFNAANIKETSRELYAAWQQDKIKTAVHSAINALCSPKHTFFKRVPGGYALNGKAPA